MGCLQDIGCGSVVLLQLDYLSIPEILLKFQDISDVRTSPLVDALVIVAYHAYVIMRLSQHLYESILDLVGILIFVHHYVSEPALIFQQHSFIFLKKLHGIEKQVVKVHGIVFLQCLLVCVINLPRHLCFEVIPVDLEVVFRRDALLFAFADDAEKVCRRISLSVDIRFFAYVSDEGLLVRRVVNCEVFAVAQNFSVSPQYPEAC